MSVCIDTNLWLYLLLEGQDESKASRIRACLATIERPVIPSQVIVECIANLIRKARCPADRLQSMVGHLLDCGQFWDRDQETILAAMRIHGEGGFSWWDALIVGAALQSGCRELWSEDLQHGRVIDGRLHILNPLLATA